jgi:hypothetical protein
VAEPASALHSVWQSLPLPFTASAALLQYSVRYLHQQRNLARTDRRVARTMRSKAGMTLLTPSARAQLHEIWLVLWQCWC